MKKYYLILLLFILILAFILPGFFFPSDILYYLPSFSISDWERPSNSLLADPVFQFEPWRIYAKTRLLMGEFPLWNDRNGSGAPFFANPQTAIFYPLNFLYYIFPVKFALWIVPMLKIYLLGLFTFLYLNVIKISRKVSLIGASLIAFSGFMVMWLMWPQTNVFILLPLILWTSEKIFQKGKKHRYYALTAIVYAISVFGGHPETLFHIVLIHGLYVIYRFWGNARIQFKIGLSAIVGLMIGAIQVVPFLEYLLNSYALETRLQGAEKFFLPVKSFVVNFIPFVFGLPQTEFYKSPEIYTNFQEIAGGYVGPMIIFIALLGFNLIKSNTIYRFWFILVILIWVSSYNIWPLSIVNDIPYIKALANQRLIGFAGFGLIVIASLSLDRHFRKNARLPNLLTKSSYVVIISLLALSLVSYFVINDLSLQTEKMRQFLYFVNNNFLFLISTSLLIIFFLFKKNSSKFYLPLLVLLLFQGIFFLRDYNAITKNSQYYPRTELINTILGLPDGRVIDIGNPNLPANINLAYGIDHVENNDAIEINKYKNAFDNAFPIRNHLGKVDQVNLSSLQNFGIQYVISDYDINLDKRTVNSSSGEVLAKLITDNEIHINIKGDDRKLAQIRIITANFNRVNKCTISVSLYDKKSLITRNSFLCQDARDKMFYTISINPQVLKKNKNYKIIISSNALKESDAIALLGDRELGPFIELLYSKEQKYEQLFNRKSVYLFKVPKGRELSINSGNAEILINTPELISVETLSDIETSLEFKKVFYPGWTALIDGEKVQIKNKNVFMRISIPAGRHLVEIKYKPLSVYIGALISLLSLLALLVYFLRQEIGPGKDYIMGLRQHLEHAQKMQWWEHGVFISGVVILLSIITISFYLIFPIKFILPYTTSINWYTVNNYPKQQDYFYVITSVFVIFVLSLIAWGLWIWRKK